MNHLGALSLYVDHHVDSDVVIALCAHDRDVIVQSVTVQSVTVQSAVVQNAIAQNVVDRNVVDQVAGVRSVNIPIAVVLREVVPSVDSLYVGLQKVHRLVVCVVYACAMVCGLVVLHS